MADVLRDLKVENVIHIMILMLERAVIKNLEELVAVQDILVVFLPHSALNLVHILEILCF